MKRLAAIGMCMVLALAMLVPSSASAARAETKVTVDHWFPGGPSGDGFWTGRVKSVEKACRKDRHVTLYMSLGEKNTEIGDDESAKGAAGGWVWAVQTEEIPEEGAYFAFVAPKFGCKGDESKTFRYPEDNAPRKR